MSKTALYARVSTDAQAEKGFSIEAQLDKLRTFCALNDVANYEEYVDAGYSASSLDRPEIQRLIQDIKAGAVNSVIVYKLDRLSRKTKDTLHLVEDVFIKHDVKFVSLSESIDTSTSSGKFFLSILSSVAQLERENIRERGMLGMRKKAELGIKSRTPKILIGYDYDEANKKFTVNEYEAMQVRLIYEKFLKGESVGSIFRYLEANHTNKYGKWKCMKNVQLILDNETYTGKFVYQKNYVDGNNIPQIIDAETFAKAKEIRDYQKKHYYRHTAAYLLTGLLFCDVCGARLRGFPKYDKSVFYYACYSRSSNIAYMVKKEGCTLPYLRCDALEEAVIRNFKKIVESKAFFNETKSKSDSNVESEIRFAEKEIKKLSEKSSRIVDLLIEAEIDKDTFMERLSETNKQKELIEVRLATLKKSTMPKMSVAHEQIKEMYKAYVSADFQQKREILAKLIHKIVVCEDKSIRIDWTF